MRQSVLLNIFKELLLENHKSSTASYAVASIPSVKNHKIGAIENDQLAFFVNCQKSEGKKVLDVNLASIKVEFCKVCELMSKDGERKKGIYTIISLKSNESDIQEYFIDTIILILKRLTISSGIDQLIEELNKIINIFSSLSNPPKKTIQGLWAELLIIFCASDPAYLVKSWHVSKNDMYDFNDGIDKIEVKSTSKLKRVHRFSYQQLKANEKSGLLIASVFVVQTGVGKNVFDLVKDIENKVSDTLLRFKLNEILAETLGWDLEKAGDLFFDFNEAADSIAFFDSKTLQLFASDAIPKSIDNITFDYDLSNSPHCKNKNASKLHKAAF